MSTATMDLEQARFNMVEQQIRPWEVLDPAVLDLMMTVRREDFVPENYRAVAFADLQVPLENGSKMWEPKVEARLIQELGLRKSDRVLEIGTGSGYMAALLAANTMEVVSFEIDRAQAERAKKNLARAEVRNVVVENADGTKGCAAKAPFDVIVVTASLPADSPTLAALQAQLKVGGRMAVIVGEVPLMLAQIVTQTAEGVFSAVTVFETSVEPLKGIKPAATFKF